VISPSTEREEDIDIGAGRRWYAMSGDPRSVSSDEEADGRLPVVSFDPLPGIVVCVMKGVVDGVSCGETRSAAQMKFEDSTVLSSQSAEVPSLQCLPLDLRNVNILLFPSWIAAKRTPERCPCDTFTFFEPES
jgi:hypothetical protein